MEVETFFFDPEYTLEYADDRSEHHALYKAKFSEQTAELTEDGMSNRILLSTGRTNDRDISFSPQSGGTSRTT